MGKFGCKSVGSFLKYFDKIGIYIFKRYVNKEKDDRACAIVGKAHGLDAALHKLNWDKATQEKALKKFVKIGVSPVGLPLRCEYG